MGIGEDGKLRVHRDVTVDRSGSRMLDGGWSFSWDDCRVLDEKDTDAGMSLVGLAEDKWSFFNYFMIHSFKVLGSHLV